MLHELCIFAQKNRKNPGFVFYFLEISSATAIRPDELLPVTTHNPELQRGLNVEGKSKRVANFVHNLIHDLEQLQAATGHASHSDLCLDNLYVPEGSILHHQLNPHHT